MFNFVRKVVAGPKKMMEYQGKDLDLTYISQRLIAMAFPACTRLEKMYRNDIADVAEYLNNQHQGNYLILNVSNRLYDYRQFQDKVKDYDWPDHQAPALTTLVNVGFAMYNFLKSSKDGVIAIHCNHGKGRTGTGIISFMILIRYIDSAEVCLKLYNNKRFSAQDYGVDQPCQLRYLKYIEELVNAPKIGIKLPFYRLKKVTQKGLDQRYFLRIRTTRTQEDIVDKLKFDEVMDQKQSKNMIYGDIFIQLFRESKIKERKKVSRINCNLYFLNPDSLQLTFSSKEVKLQRKDVPQFSMTFHFEYFCLCHLNAYEKSMCRCSLPRVSEQMFWKQMIKEIKQCKNLDSEEVLRLVHGDHYELSKEFLNSKDMIREKKSSVSSSSSDIKPIQKDTSVILDAKKRKLSMESEATILRKQKIKRKMESYRKMSVSSEILDQLDEHEQEHINQQAQTDLKKVRSTADSQPSDLKILGPERVSINAPIVLQQSESKQQL